MVQLKPAHAAAISRLKNYVPPPTQYYSLPLTRRAAVLILLFSDKHGELRVVLTMRAKTLSSYAGQAALPGGKADTLSETPIQTARREAWEEIGLPLLGTKLPKPFRITTLCQMPCNLARTELGVRPCIAYLSSNPLPSDNWPADKPIPAIEDSLIPRLDAKEVAAVFSAPFHSFLKQTDAHMSTPAGEKVGIEAAGLPAEWYQGVWTDWHESRWRMHNFYVPIAGQNVTWALEPTSSSSASIGSTSIPFRDLPDPKTAHREAKDSLRKFRVFGMTARILVDAARVAFGEDPEFEHNSHFGDEDMIGRLLKMGRLGAVRKPGEALTREVLTAAAKI